MKMGGIKRRRVKEDIGRRDAIGWNRYWVLVRVACNSPYNKCSQNTIFLGFFPRSKNNI